MAYVVARKNGRFEVRESRNTPKGPRSRTLASFAELSDEAIEQARAQADGPLDVAALRESAIRAGAPAALSPLEDSARRTLRHLASGEALDPMLRRLLLDALSRGADRANDTGRAGGFSDAARAATQWIGSTLTERGEALRDLLELTDALPLRLREPEIGFPRLDAA